MYTHMRAHAHTQSQSVNQLVISLAVLMVRGCPFFHCLLGGDPRPSHHLCSAIIALGCKVWYHCICPGVLYKELRILPSVSPVPNASEVLNESVHKSYPNNWMHSYLQLPATDNNTILQKIYIICVKYYTYIHTHSKCTKTNLQHNVPYMSTHRYSTMYVRITLQTSHCDVHLRITCHWLTAGIGAK